MSKVYKYEDDNELVPYRASKKDKKHSKGIVNSKSNHKHLYEDCLVLSDCNGHPHMSVGKYCTVCDKTITTQFFITVPSDTPHCRRMVSGIEEIKGLYPNLPIKEESK